MSRIKGKNTKPEILLRRFLYSRGYRYRLHAKTLPGKPDIVLPKIKTVVFVHGCFWHGHKRCRLFVLPKTRAKWWAEKIARNQITDARNLKLLRKAGWNVIVVWACKLSPKRKDETFSRLDSKLKKVYE